MTAPLKHVPHGNYRRADYFEERCKKLESALTMLYDKWENGTPCYEDVETCDGPLGNAFQLTEAEENQCLALIPNSVLTRPSAEPSHSVTDSIDVDPPCDKEGGT